MSGGWISTRQRRRLRKELEDNMVSDCSVKTHENNKDAQRIPGVRVKSTAIAPTIKTQPSKSTTTTISTISTKSKKQQQQQHTRQSKDLHSSYDDDDSSNNNNNDIKENNDMHDDFLGEFSINKEHRPTITTLTPRLSCSIKNLEMQPLAKKNYGRKNTTQQEAKHKTTSSESTPLSSSLDMAVVEKVIKPLYAHDTSDTLRILCQTRPRDFLHQCTRDNRIAQQGYSTRVPLSNTSTTYRLALPAHVSLVEYAHLMLARSTFKQSDQCDSLSERL